jgi:hypothetical protein
VINVDDRLLPYNVLLPLAISMHNRVHLLVTIKVVVNPIRECLAMIGHWMSMLSEDCTNSMI